MIDYCDDCLTRDVCECLCQKADAWVNQDKVNRNYREHLTSSGYSWEFDLHNNDANKYALTFKEMFGGTPFLELLEWRIVKKLKLTKQQMQTMWLYYWELLTQEKTAQKLGITQQTVSEHLEAARGKLSIELKEKEKLLEVIKAAPLTQRQAEIAELYYKWDATQTQIAKKLGISQQTVQEHLEKIKIFIK